MGSELVAVPDFSLLHRFLPRAAKAQEPSLFARRIRLDRPTSTRIAHHLTAQARDQPAKPSVSICKTRRYEELALFGNSVSR